MKDEYDFTNAVKNPYVLKDKKQITINLSNAVIDYFKNLAQETGLPYQVLINMYLLDCVENDRKPKLVWG